MVHVMTPKSRLFYDIEGQWRERGGEYLDLSDVLVDELNAAAASSEEDGKKLVGLEKSDEEMMTMRERLDVEKEEDPFWS